MDLPFDSEGKADFRHGSEPLICGMTFLKKRDGTTAVEIRLTEIDEHYQEAVRKWREQHPPEKPPAKE
jgi:hypothetical protein